MNVPHERCNFINDRIMLGAVPEQKDLNNIIHFGFNMFVNLEDLSDTDNGLPWYTHSLPSNIISLSFPIKTGKALTKSQESCIPMILQHYSAGHNIYIHCSGGHGRAGMVGAILLGKLYNLDAAEAIHYIEQFRENRIDKSRNFVPTPETTTQVQYVHSQLGLKPGNTLPDRSDTRWIGRVKKERKETQKLAISSFNSNIANPIYFYTDNKDYGEFSNFYLSSFEYYGIIYPTAEHCFQSSKFLTNTIAEWEYKQIIASQNTPNKAFVLGQMKIKSGYPWVNELNQIIRKYVELGVSLRPYWDLIKVYVMFSIVYTKFSSNDSLKYKLLSTGNRQIVEHTDKDDFWADGKNGTGQNFLGRILMSVRDLLK